MQRTVKLAYRTHALEARLHASLLLHLALGGSREVLALPDEAGRHLESLEMDRPVGEQLLTQFYRAVTSLVRQTQDLDDAYAALQVVMAAQQSHDEGRRILLERPT